MPNRSMARSEAQHQARRLRIATGRELRIARLMAGKRLVDVAAAVRTSPSHLSRLERGLATGARLEQIALVSMYLGLRPSLKLYPTGRRPLDAPQLALLGRLRNRVGSHWQWRTEVPMPIAGDLRAVDALLTGPVTIAIEAWTRFVDYQAQSRAGLLKQRDLGADRLILLIAVTHANRAVVRAAGPLVGASFPMGTRATLEALAAGRDPGANAIVLL